MWWSSFRFSDASGLSGVLWLTEFDWLTPEWWKICPKGIGADFRPHFVFVGEIECRWDQTGGSVKCFRRGPGKTRDLATGQRAKRRPVLVHNRIFFSLRQSFELVSWVGCSSVRKKKPTLSPTEMREEGCGERWGRGRRSLTAGALRGLSECRTRRKQPQKEPAEHGQGCGVQSTSITRRSRPPHGRTDGRPIHTPIFNPERPIDTKMSLGRPRRSAGKKERTKERENERKEGRKEERDRERDRERERERETEKERSSGRASFSFDRPPMVTDGFNWNQRASSIAAAETRARLPKKETLAVDTQSFRIQLLLIPSCASTAVYAGGSLTPQFHSRRFNLIILNFIGRNWVSLAIATFDITRKRFQVSCPTISFWKHRVNEPTWNSFYL